MLDLQTANTYTGGTTINAGTLVLDSVGGSLAPTGALTVNGGTFDMSQIQRRHARQQHDGGGAVGCGRHHRTRHQHAHHQQQRQHHARHPNHRHRWAYEEQGSGTSTLSANNTYSGGTVVSGGLVNFSSAAPFGTGAITLNSGGLQWAAGSSADISSKLAPLGAAGSTFDTNDNIVTLASTIGGTGGLVKQGGGK